jgi:hypothetical protein
MDLSIVLGGRDDNYGEQFIDRLEQAVSHNLKLLDSSGIDYEMIVVDFNPINEQYLYVNSLMEEILQHPRVKNLIVDPSVSVAEDLTPSTYYEYFAKNAGCRISTGKLIFITNSDIMLTEKLIEEIKKEFDSDEKNDVFYRVRYRGDISLGDSPSLSPRLIPNGDVLTGPLNGWGDPEQVLDLYENLKYHNLLGEDPVIGLWSGDACMFSRDVFFNVATAYNEGDFSHRTNKNQSNMDTEILWNLKLKGKELKLIDAPYYHIYHGHPLPRDNSSYTKLTYENKSDWGFTKYNKQKINSNTEIIINGEIEWD